MIKATTMTMKKYLKNQRRTRIQKTRRTEISWKVNGPSACHLVEWMMLIDRSISREMLLDG